VASLTLQGRDSARPSKSEYVIALLLIERHLGQNRRLDDVFGFFLFLVGMHRLSAWIHQVRSHENDQVALDVLINVRAEKAADSEIAWHARITVGNHHCVLGSLFLSVSNGIRRITFFPSLISKVGTAG
jgi:hypothetical protein